jgi:hypothetical protein
MTRPPTPSDREVHVSDANEAGSWEGILGPGEEIVWQGAPVQDLFWQFDRRKTIAGIGAAAGAVTLLAFIYRPATDGSGNPILVFLAWAVIAAVVYHAWSFWDRRRTFYTLTNKRAFIATWHFGVQTLRAYPIASMRPLRLEDTRPGHVWFDHDTVRRKDRSTGRWEEHIVEVGFLNLANPREVRDALVRLGAEPA